MDRICEASSNSSGQGGETRLCPYCEKCIPASEDRCHHCGHLEPAEIAPQKGKESLRLYIGLLLLGVAMLVFAGVKDPSAYICEPDETFSCLIRNAWSVPMGILLVTVCLLNLIWGMIANTQVDKRAKKDRPHGASRGQKGAAYH